MNRIISVMFVSLSFIGMADDPHPINQDLFGDPDFPSIRYYYRRIYPSIHSTDIAITKVEVESTVKEPVDVEPGKYAYFWGLHVRSIDASAFEGCKAIRSVVLPSGMTGIGRYAFSRCSNLEVVRASDIDVGYGAFYGCGKLKDVSIQAHTVGDFAFCGCAALENVSLGSSLTSVGDSAFCNCLSLKSVTLREGLSWIGSSVFYGCDKLESVIFHGACPMSPSDVFESANQGLTVFATGSAVGWPQSGDLWNGRKFLYGGLDVKCQYPSTSSGMYVEFATPIENGCVTYYTINGESPSSSNPNRIQYTGRPFEICGNTTVRAVVEKNNIPLDSPKSFSFAESVPTPTFELEEGMNGFRHLRISDQMRGVELFYDLGIGVLSKQKAALYTEPILVMSNMTIRVFASKSGFYNSTLAETSVVCKVPTPEIISSPFNGTDYTVSISCFDSRAKVYYTTNGQDPDSHGVLYDGVFKLSGPATIKAIAVVQGCVNSDTATQNISTDLKALDVSSITVDSVVPWGGLLKINYDLTLDVVRPNAALQLEVSVLDVETGSRYSSSASALYGEIDFNAGHHSVAWHALVDGVNISSIATKVSLSIVAIESDGTKTVLQTAEVPNVVPIDTRIRCIDMDCRETVRLSMDALVGADRTGTKGVAVCLDGDPYLETADSHFDFTARHFGTNLLSCANINSDGTIGEPLFAKYNVTNGPEVAISPATNTVFVDRLKITMTCSEADCVIHYTVDGTTPTIDSPVFSKRNITSKTEIKAVAIRDDGFSGKISSVIYAPGKCEAPIIWPDDGATFEDGELNVYIVGNADDIIRYTTDGSDPTENSPLFSDAIRITQNAVVKARAFNSQYLDSEIVESTFWRKASPPLIIAEEEFEGDRQFVRIVTSDPDAKVYYTIDGSNPTEANGTLYKGEFSISGDACIRAMAIADQMISSDFAEQTVTALTPPSGEGNYIQSVELLENAFWDGEYIGRYQVGGNSKATELTGYLFVVYRGVTNRLFCTTLEAGAGQHEFRWKPEDEGYLIAKGERIEFIVQLRDKKLTAVYPWDAPSDGYSNYFDRNWYVRDYLLHWGRMAGVSSEGLQCWTCTNSFSLAECVIMDLHSTTSGRVKIGCKSEDVTYDTDNPDSPYFPGCIDWSRNTDYSSIYSLWYPDPKWYVKWVNLAANESILIGWTKTRKPYACDMTPGKYTVFFGGEIDTTLPSDCRKIKSTGIVSTDSYFNFKDRTLRAGDVLKVPLDPSWDGGDSVTLYVNGQSVFSVDHRDVYEFHPVYAGEYQLELKTFNGRYNQVLSSRKADWNVIGPNVVVHDERAAFEYETVVRLSVADPDATVFYTLDGSVPDENSREYTGPIWIDRSLTLTAMAILPNGGCGKTVKRSYTRLKTISDFLGLPDVRVVNDAVAPWFFDADTNLLGFPAVRSGAIENFCTTAMSAAFKLDKSGIIKFYWKSSCEDDPDFDDWDYGSFELNGKEICRIDGKTDWEEVRVELPEGEYTAVWKYSKDESDESSDVGEDCIWVSKLEMGEPVQVVFDFQVFAVTNVMAKGFVPLVPDPPELAHLSFMGWEGDVTVPVTSNTVFMAIWERVFHAVEFLTDAYCTRTSGGELSQVVEHGYTADIPVVDPGVGRIFKGWSGDPTAPILSNSVFVANVEYAGRTGKVGNGTWVITEDTGILTFYGCTSIPYNAYTAWQSYVDEIRSIVVPDSVTSIGENAFKGASNVTSVVVADSVRYINKGAFSGCSSITNMVLPFAGQSRDTPQRESSVLGYIFGSSAYIGGVGRVQYYSSNGFAYYYIPASLQCVEITDATKIGYGAFYNCSELQAVILPEKLSDVGEDAFYGCQGLGDGAIVQHGFLLALNGTIGVDLVLPDDVRKIPAGILKNHSELKSITISTNVVEIREAAFSGCSSLTNMVLPFVGSTRGSGMEKGLFGYIFGEGSFSGAERTRQYYTRSTGYNACDKYYYIPKGLKNVTITDAKSISFGAFYNCGMLTSVTISNAAHIYEDAFYNCRGLYSIALPQGAETIEDSAFSGCSNLRRIDVNDVQSWFAIKFATNSANPLSYGGGLYSNGAEVKELVVPPGIVKAYALYGCKGISSVSFQEGVSSIGDCAFCGCDSIKSIVFPMQLRSIGNSAFKGCANLVSLELPDSVTSMGTGAFYGCKSLVDVKISNGLKTVSFEAFGLCASLKSINIPDGVTCIGGSAFLGCSGVKSVVISKTVSEICSRTFYNCSSLNEIIIPHGVTTIGEYAFYSCSGLTSVTIPESLSSVGSNAFGCCYSLTTINVSKGDAARVKNLYAWPSTVEFVEVDTVSVEGDPSAMVIGDATTGFIIRPTVGNLAVEVSIPQGVDAAKVTVEVSPKVASVKPNGATVMIVSGGDDITDYLSMPAADGNGVIDLTKVTVKDEFVEEAMDIEKGAVIKLDAANPSLTTPNTRRGLFYQLREGVTLGGMKDGDSTIGNGEPWSPKITVKGGNSAFYSIGVGKGE